MKYIAGLVTITKEYSHKNLLRTNIISFFVYLFAVQDVLVFL